MSIEAGGDVGKEETITHILYNSQALCKRRAQRIGRYFFEELDELRSKIVET